jgi:hypothetical protein
MNANKKMPPSQIQNLSQPRPNGWMTASLIPNNYQAPPPGSRHMQRLTFIEESFPLNTSIQKIHQVQSDMFLPQPSSSYGQRNPALRYE